MLEECINIIDELMVEKASSLVRKGTIEGTGVKMIHAALIAKQIAGRNSQDPKIRYSDVFDALCTSVESLSIFKFEGADALDCYFSLRGPKDEMLKIAESVETPPLFDKSMYEIDGTPVEMPHFEQLSREVGCLLQEELDLASSNTKLKRENDELEMEVTALGNPSSTKKQITAMQDVLSKLE